MGLEILSVIEIGKELILLPFSVLLRNLKYYNCFASFKNLWF